jgi:hypothetical protein
MEIRLKPLPEPRSPNPFSSKSSIESKIVLQIANEDQAGPPCTNWRGRGDPSE